MSTRSSSTFDPADVAADRPIADSLRPAVRSEVMVVNGRATHVRVNEASSERPSVVPSASTGGRLLLRLDDRAEPARHARREIARHCAGRIPANVLDDVQLVVSELVTNAVEHGGTSDGLRVELAVRRRDVDILVSGAGDRHHVPHRWDWTMPAADAVSGRGLALVWQLAGGTLVDGGQSVDGGRGWVAVTASVPIR